MKKLICLGTACAMALTMTACTASAAANSALSQITVPNAETEVNENITRKYGKVLSVDGNTVTLQMGTMDGLSKGPAPEGVEGNAFDGQTPPEKPEGENGEAMTPPEKPEGENSEAMTPPEKPEGENGEAMTPPEKPEGENGEAMTPPKSGKHGKGRRGMGAFTAGEETETIDLTGITVTVGRDGEAAEIAVDDILILEYEENVLTGASVLREPAAKETQQ